MVLGLLLLAFLRSLLSLESASFSGTFGSGLFPLFTMTALVLCGTFGASGFVSACRLLPLSGPFGSGEFLLLAVEPLVLGLLLSTVLRSLFSLESASFSGAFGLGLFLLLAMTALVFCGAFGPGPFLLLAAEPFILGLLLRTFASTYLGIETFLFSSLLSAILTLAFTLGSTLRLRLFLLFTLALLIVGLLLCALLSAFLGIDTFLFFTETLFVFRRALRPRARVWLCSLAGLPLFI